jgi:hypothetical protein
MWVGRRVLIRDKEAPLVSDPVTSLEDTHEQSIQPPELRLTRLARPEESVGVNCSGPEGRMENTRCRERRR